MKIPEYKEIIFAKKLTFESVICQKFFELKTFKNKMDRHQKLSVLLVWHSSVAHRDTFIKIKLM